MGAGGGITKSDSDFGISGIIELAVVGGLLDAVVAGGGRNGTVGIEVGPGRSADGGDVMGVVMAERSGDEELLGFLC